MSFSQLLSLYNSSECPGVLKQLKIQASNQYQFAAFLQVFHVQTSIKKKPQLKPKGIARQQQVLVTALSKKPFQVKPQASSRAVE